MDQEWNQTSAHQQIVQILLQRRQSKECHLAPSPVNITEPSSDGSNSQLSSCAGWSRCTCCLPDNELPRQELWPHTELLMSSMFLQMMANPHADKIFPKDVLKRAKEYLAAIPGGTGAYTSSQGAPICREHVAAGITHRDNGIKSDPGNIFMSDGASQVGLIKLSISTSCVLRFSPSPPQARCLSACMARLPLHDAVQKLGNAQILLAACQAAGLPRSNQGLISCWVIASAADGIS